MRYTALLSGALSRESHRVTGRRVDRKRATAASGDTAVFVDHPREEAAKKDEVKGRGPGGSATRSASRGASTLRPNSGGRSRGLRRVRSRRLGVAHPSDQIRLIGARNRNLERDSTFFVFPPRKRARVFWRLGRGGGVRDSNINKNNIG